MITLKKILVLLIALTMIGIQIITVYGDLEGNAEITNISTPDPAEFNQ